MDKVPIWARTDLDGFNTDQNNFPLYSFQCGIKKSYLKHSYFPEHGDPYINLGVTSEIAPKVYEIVDNPKRYRKYYYPFPWPVIDPQLFDEAIEIEPKHLKNIKKGKCKILVINTMEGWNHDNFFKTIIDYLIKRYNLNYGNFVILNGNMSKTNYKVPTVYYNWWEQHTRQHNVVKYANSGFWNTNATKKRYRFICLNRRPHAHRLLLTSLLYKYKDRGVLTCFKEVDNGCTRVFERSLKYGLSSYPNLKNLVNSEFLDKLPLTINDGINAADDNPVIDSSDSKFYDSWLHVVTETFAVNGQTFFSEKIFKPIMYWQPFILIGAQHDLKALRSLGYKTFNGIIDESYDDIGDHDNRLMAAYNEIERIITMTDDEIAEFYNKCYDIIVHNFYHWVYRQHTIHTGLKADLLKVLG